MKNLRKALELLEEEIKCIDYEKDKAEWNKLVWLKCQLEAYIEIKEENKQKKRGVGN